MNILSTRITRFKSFLSTNQKGAGFIEVLVALVILAIGLLGVMSMQARGLSSNQRAQFATDVNLLAYDMADRILAHGIAGAGTGEYAGLSTAAAFQGDDAVAVADQLAWQTALNASSLPSARGDVAWDGDTNTYTITIRWDDFRSGVAAGVIIADCASNSPATLSCFQLRLSL